MFQSVNFYFQFYDYAKDDFDRARNMVLMVQDIAKDSGDDAVVALVDSGFDRLRADYGVVDE